MIQGVKEGLGNWMGGAAIRLRRSVERENLSGWGGGPEPVLGAAKLQTQTVSGDLGTGTQAGRSVSLGVICVRRFPKQQGWTRWPRGWVQTRKRAWNTPLLREWGEVDGPGPEGAAGRL